MPPELAEHREAGTDRTSRDSRLTVRIRPDDPVATARNVRRCAARMAAATYVVSVLTRSHLRSLAPLPKAEWLMLEKIVTELSRKLGRKHQPDHSGLRTEESGVSDPGSTQFRAMLTICTILRVHIPRGLLQAECQELLATRVCGLISD